MGEQMSPITVNDLDYYSSVPLYLQLSNILTRKINDQELKANDHLPTELFLCKTLNLSRSTVRRAFAILEREGVIIRKPRLGTLVCKPKLNRNLNTLYNFSYEMACLGMVPSSKLLRFEIGKPNPTAMSQLNISENESVFKITRLRIANDRPILVETAYIPFRFCRDLTEDKLNDSLYTLISQYTNAQPKEATEVYEAVSLKEREAELFGCRAGTPAFKIMRTSTNTNGDIFEYSEIIAPGDRNQYEITLHRDDVQYKKIM